MGGISQQRGQVDKALTYYRKVLQIDPSDQNTIANMTMLYRQAQ
ncbi:tetratricopeptide repeat protein [Granulicella aggregans]